MSYLNSVHNSGCFLNYSQQFVVQEFLGKEKVEIKWSVLLMLKYLTLWEENVGFPKGSCLGSLLFIISYSRGSS